MTTVPSGTLGGQDTSPDEARVLYRRFNGSSSEDWLLTLPTPTTTATTQRVDTSFGASFASVTGFLDNQTLYADTSPSEIRSSNLVAPSSITRNSVLSVSEGVAVPAHLGGSGTKDFLVCIARDVDASGTLVGPTGVRLHPTAYGGDIHLWDLNVFPWLSVRNVSIDRSASRVAFVARDIGGDAQIYTVATNREINVTYVNPVTTSTGGTYTATAGCALNEVCVLAVASVLAPTPIPWGPPGLIEIDTVGAVLFASGANGPVSGSFTIPDNPANYFLPLYFQAVRFDATSNNTSRTARVRFL